MTDKVSGRRRLRLHTGMLLALVAAAAGGLAAINCSSDEDTSVSIVNSCTAASLNTSDPPEATVKAYSDTATELLQRAQALEGKFKDVCNAMNRDMGDKEGGDMRAACNNVANRIKAAQDKAPVPDGGTAPIWTLVRFDDLLTGCKVDTVVESQCRQACGGAEGGAACDPVATCQPAGAVIGACGATCTGTCRAGGDAVPCNGECRGTCNAPGGGVDGGQPACTGECQGTCAAATWTGRCDVGCKAGFVGVCGGQCNGTCGTEAVGTQPPICTDGGAPEAGVDAGSDAGDAGDDADAGVADAGPKPDGGGNCTAVPPGRTGDGNCTGICRGSCTAKASGSCTAPCAGQFAGGTCAGAGACTGNCIANSAACITTCSGFCISAAAGTQCTGDCQGTCSQPVTGPKCEGTVSCEANSECARVCHVRGALAAKCAKSPAPEIRIAGDYALYDALRNHGVDFIQLTQEVILLRDASDGMIQRTIGNFRTIGVRSDNALKCVEQTIPVVEQARASLNLSFDATQVLNGKAF